ncbi:hypothetical protein [Tropicimonas marinistellae]|uniref:hypothetical protein n=1 Tax=Tropicimonas marinistellae TaxID=1739787 RepID=UPI001372711F|nr:hypothetical protein [Tropicimonas marinistellae]
MTHFDTTDGKATVQKPNTARVNHSATKHQMPRPGVTHSAPKTWRFTDWAMI